MSVKIIRVAEGKNSTLSHLYIDDIFQCYLLEDQARKIKIAGSTCIPEGNFELRLNSTAAMNARYRLLYPQLHKGMVEIKGIPDFNLVFIHIGNFHSDTAGCPLTGHYWNKLKGEYQVMQSAFAYQLVYPKLLEKIRKGEGDLSVTRL